MNLDLANPLDAIACHSRQSRALARQAPRRAAEDQVRRQAVELCDELAALGHPRRQVARRLSLRPRTLRRWRRARRELCSPPPRGRPCKQSSSIRRHAVLEFLEREGPHLGLPTLRAVFDDMPRCELRELQAAYRQHYQESHTCLTHKLTWHVPGSVWAMDHSKPPSSVDDVDDVILAVRDLASGMQLAWLPVPDETSQTTSAVLNSLLAQHAAPLVIKSDNGSAFKSNELAQLLEDHRIVWLPSPPRRPQYNGSCEAGIGSMKTRTRHFAALHGRVDCWSYDELEAARRQANELTRPQGHLGPTPFERWTARSTPTEVERDHLAAAIARHRADILNDPSHDFDSNNKNHMRHVQRHSVQRALLELGLLTITRRSVPLPIQPQKVANIP